MRVRLIPLLGRNAEKRGASFSYLHHMAVVCAATPSHHVQVREPPPKTGILHPEFGRVADVKFGRVVKLNVAHTRCVRPKTSDATQPRPAAAQHVLEMRGVGAINHVVTGIA